MSSPCIRIPRLPDRVVSSARDSRRKTSLANRAVDIHGKSRAQVLESGGRVDKGVDSEARSLDGADDSGLDTEHRARSATRADSGGLKLSSGKASNLGCRGYRTQFPSQGEMTYG